jgi:carboxyl-terminal processing protease
MKKGIKYFLFFVFSILCLLGLTVLFSRTIFKDKLIEYAIKLNQSEQKQIKSYYVSEIPVEPKYFAEDFKSIHDIVSGKCLLCEHKGYDMDSLYYSFANRIANESMTKADYGLLLREYFAALNIGHAGVMLTLHSAEYYPTIVENRLFIDKPNDHFTNNGFSDKDEIIAINNTPIDRYIQSMAKYTSASTDAYKTHLTQCRIFTSFTDSLIHCDVRRNGDTLKLKLPLTSSILSNTPKAHYKILRDSIGYVCIESMMDNVVENFKQAYNHKGTSVIECLVNCLVWNDGAHKNIETVSFKNGDKFEMAGVEFIYDTHDKDLANLVLNYFDGKRQPLIVGVIYETERPTYEEVLYNQMKF